MRTFASAALAAFLVFSVLHSAHAEDAAVTGVHADDAAVTSARLELVSDGDCTSRSDLERRITERAPQIRFVEEDSGAVRIRAQFTAISARQVAAEVAIGTGDAPLRRVLAKSCSEAAEAIAVIVAVAFGIGTPSAESLPTSRTAQADSAGEKSRTRSARPPVAAQRNLSTPSEPSRESGAENAWPSHVSRRVALGLAAQAYLAPSPGVMSGIALYARVNFVRGELLSPAFALSATHAVRTGVNAQGGSAAFTLDALTLDACPFRLGPPRVDVLGCASGLVGRLAASGSETSNPVGPVGRPFISLGAVALVAWRLLPSWELSARFGVGGNLVRDSFAFASSIFHEVPAFTVSGGVGIGANWD